MAELQRGGCLADRRNWSTVPADHRRPAAARRPAVSYKTTSTTTTHKSVVVSLLVNCLETVGLGVTAWATGSIAVRAQPAAEAAEVAVVVFLLIGVLSSIR